MEGMLSDMSPQERNMMDRATHQGPFNQFNMTAQNQHLATQGPHHFGFTSPRGPTNPNFELNNGVPTQFSVPAHTPLSAPGMPNQGRSPQFNMPIQSPNTSVRGLNQDSPNRFNIPFQDPTALLQGQNQGANNHFPPFFQGHMASPDMLYQASEHHPGFQGELNFPAQGHNQGASSQLNMATQDPHLQTREQIPGTNGQNHPTPQPSPRAQDHRQDVTHSFSQPSNEPQTRPHENQGGHRPNLAPPVQSTTPSHSPGARSPTVGPEINLLPRGRQVPNLRELQTPNLARPRPNNIQHSPPRRAFHSPITPDIPADVPSTSTPAEAAVSSALLSPAAHPMTRASTNNTEHLRQSAAREAVVRQRLAVAEHTKKLNLQQLTASFDEQGALERDLAKGWAQPDANANLQMLYEREMRLMELKKLWQKYARAFRTCEEEIEELWADLMVPDET